MKKTECVLVKGRPDVLPKGSNAVGHSFLNF